MPTPTMAELRKATAEPTRNTHFCPALLLTSCPLVYFLPIQFKTFSCPRMINRLLGKPRPPRASDSSHGRGEAPFSLLRFWRLNLSLSFVSPPLSPSLYSFSFSLSLPLSFLFPSPPLPLPLPSISPSTLPLSPFPSSPSLPLPLPLLTNHTYMHIHIYTEATPPCPGGAGGGGCDGVVSFPPLLNYIIPFLLSTSSQDRIPPIPVTYHGRAELRLYLLCTARAWGPASAVRSGLVLRASFSVFRSPFSSFVLRNVDRESVSHLDRGEAPAPPRSVHSHSSCSAFSFSLLSPIPFYCFPYTGRSQHRPLLPNPLRPLGHLQILNRNSSMLDYESSYPM